MYWLEKGSWQPKAINLLFHSHFDRMQDEPLPEGAPLFSFFFFNLLEHKHPGTWG